MAGVMQVNQEKTKIEQDISLRINYINCPYYAYYSFCTKK
ncbi:hypothetical protein RINTHH_9390 [Richelia intracellularis HH01]|uniref:Uncharacterized protein n=1 Tax=Richelia intracellularis HH01 TaxID=1165094 RepID=M1WRU0_9NOST|nr:hypothetical protein RINTHH_9390 [Richelia intracellularis HH01]